MNVASILALIIRYVPVLIAGLHVLYVLATKQPIEPAVASLLTALGLNVSVAAAHAKIDSP